MSSLFRPRELHAVGPSSLSEPPAPAPDCGPACAAVFDRVSVSRLIHGGTTVMWDLVPTFDEPGPYDFRLQAGLTANPLADDWTTIASGVDSFFAVDPEQRVYGTTDWRFYRVVLATGAGVHFSDPVNALGVLPWRDWNRAREVLRKEALNAALAAEPGYLLKRRFAGPPCRVCLDPLTRSPKDPDCPSCWGTGRECGYYAPMPCVWADLSPGGTDVQLDGGAGRGTIDDDTPVQARMLAVPLLTDTDVWVSKWRDDRYYVRRIRHVKAWRGVPLVSTVGLRVVPFSSPIYDLEMPGQKDAEACP